MVHGWNWRRCAAPLLLCVVWAAGMTAAHADGAATAANAIVGNWLTEPRNGIIQISVLPDGSFQGRVIGGSNPHRLDERNPQPALRKLELLGEVIMRGMRYEGEARWSGGTIYDPSSGRTYSCRLELQDGGQLKVRGFLGVALLGRSQLWTRYFGRSMLLPKSPP
jgi:uncharacterized protein (DUF2147 family)